MPGFPAWIVGITITAAGVWAAYQIDTRAAWYLAILIVLGVLIMRDSGLQNLNAFLGAVFGSAPAPTYTPPVVPANPETNR